jgi:hypothetical protein
MDVAIVHLDDCPNWQTALERLRAAMDTLELDAVQVRDVVVPASQALADFPGSPTILVNGLDLFPIAVPAGPACRRYATGRGYEGAPASHVIHSALRAHIRPNRS